MAEQRASEHNTGSCLACGAPTNDPYCGPCTEDYRQLLDAPIAQNMRFAYADPPYLGCCALYGHEHGASAACWNEITTHQTLITSLQNDFPDGWALSSSSSALRSILPLCPTGIRIGAWVKSFCAFKKGVRPCYAWEPVIFFGGRNPNNGYPHKPPERNGTQTTPKDFLITDAPAIKEPITLRKGLTGAKPANVCQWILELLNAQPGDTLIDIFPGTGIMQDTALKASLLIR